MSRKSDLLDYVENDKTYIPLIEDIVYLEGELERLRKLPKLKVHASDPEKQKPTPAAKLYKEMLQQYLNALKLLMKASGADEIEEDSPLRQWVKAKHGEMEWRG